jgi:phage shock protein PspC (stress-responsive transcriptional regulator)
MEPSPGLAVNLADVVAEVRAAFDRYERALTTNDVATLDEMFWASPHTVRYGLGENLYGHAAIAAYRRTRGPDDLERVLSNTVITTFGRDFATASTEYHRITSGRRARQMQTWVRTPEGWRIVAAHVSWYEAPAERVPRRRLYRSTDERLIGGVCGGIAEWIGWDPTVVRVIYVVVSIVSAAFPGILAYLLLWLVVPSRRRP